MEQYEIRILKKGADPVVHVSMQASDHAAIRTARTLASPDSQVIEVWRGLRCLFTQAPEHFRLH